jgi:hypothetical protein
VHPGKRDAPFKKYCMGSVLDLINQLRSETIPKQETAILKMIEENETIIVDLNTGQLLDGIDSETEPLKEYQSEKYALMKEQLNPKGVTDLRLTGAFHDSFFLKADKWPVIFDATNVKRNQLVNKYGIDIFGLSEINKTILAQIYLAESIVAYYRNVFQLR